MDKLQAKNLIENTFNNRFDKVQFRKFIINLLDKINETKAFSVGQAQVKEAFRKYVLSYQRIGQYTDKKGNIIDALIVHLNDKCSLDRSRTFLRNFVADYMRTKGKENALVAFYRDNSADWRFSFVKLEISLKQDDKGNVKVANEYTPAKRYSYLVGELEPNHTAQSRLVELLVKEYPTLEEIEEAFNVEKVSKEFFAQYKELFLQLVDNLKDIRSKDDRINFEFTTRSITEANFCKKLLGQLVFLYFIQKKGWLGVPKGANWGEGDKQFLRHTFEKAVAEGKNFFNDYLEPLFYNALANGERDEQIFDLLECKIPFLNGGLFEPLNGYDWVNTDIVFDNSIFSNTEKNKIGDTGTGILDVFDRYNFTVKEDEPLEKEVAVDPEMLGKVFEELLEVQDRKSKGAFYTPREIVHYMCQESLINYLATELNASEDNDSDNLTKQDLSDFIHHSDQISDREAIASQKDKPTSVYKHIISENIRKNAEAIDKALADIKICDPAIGSGAFPVGMLNEIVRARIALVDSGYLLQAKKRSVYEYKRQAIQNSIYGVDIESGAVEIAKLRLWLSLVVEEDDIKNIKALPNLDYKIVCGNSLLNVPRTLFNDSLFRQLEELKPQYFNETRKSEKKRLKKEIDAIIKELTKDGIFDFEIYFSEVFHEKGGFDVVIANPPYIEFKKLPAQQKIAYEKYLTAKGKYDIYVLFIEKSNMLLRNGGIHCFINPTTFLMKDYGKSVRDFIKNNFKIIEILDFADAQIFESATTYTGIFRFQKYKNLSEYKFIVQKFNNNKLASEKIILDNNIASIYKDVLHISSQKLTNEWIFSSETKNQLREKIENVSTFILKDITKYIFQGIATGKDEVFLVDENIINENKLEKDLIFPILKGRDVNKYVLNWSKHFIIYPYDKTTNLPIRENILKEQFPNIYKYMVNNRGKLKGRDYFDKSNKFWYELWCERNYNKFNQTKIVSAEISPENRFCLDKNSFLGNTKIFSTVLKDEYSNYYLPLLVILNSKLMNFYHKIIASPKAGGFYDYKTQFIEKYPIKLPNNCKEFIEIANKLSDEYSLKSNAFKEEQIANIMVYKLYDLTYEEVLTIDKEFSMSEQEYNTYKL